MKHLNVLIIPFFLLAATQVQAQADCCSYLTSHGQSKDDRVFQETVEKYRKLFHEPPPITVMATSPGCTDSLAAALVCTPNERKFIVYNRGFFAKLQAAKSNYGISFVLAHETAHHIRAHLLPGYYTLNKPDMQGTADALAKLIQTASNVPEPVAFRASIPRLYLQELDADALGLRMIRGLGASKNDVNALLNVLYSILPPINHPLYPSWAVRRKLVLDQWDRLPKKQKEVKKVPKQMRVIAANQPDTTGADLSEEAVAGIQRETEAGYAFYLYQTPSDSLSRADLALRDSITRHDRYFIEPVFGVQFQQPELYRNNTAVRATNNVSPFGGFRVGIGSWRQKSRVETDVLISATAFNTQDIFGNQLLTVEHFQNVWLSVRPRYVYNKLLKRPFGDYYTHSLMATVGASVRKPFGFKYTNYSADPYTSPDLQPSYSPVAGVGYGLANARGKNGLARIWLLYEPQCLFLQTSSPDPVRATLHTFSIEFSVRFW